MTARIRLALTGLVALGLLTCGAMAQDADNDAAPPPATAKTHAPLIINNDTIGELRMHQVGSIVLPQGKPPFPAIIVLHGCNGVAPHTRWWARRIASWGYAALIIDSFTPRGLQQVCDGSRALPGPERARDVFAAAAYLRTRADIDGRRIGIVGYSHGGWTALNTAPEKRVAEAGASPFRAIVAFYPFCPPKASPPLASDVLIFSGEADDWAKAANCQAFVENYGTDAPHRPYFKVYAGAYHSFDAMQPEREYFGHKLVYDPKATADAVERTRKFLDEHMRPE